MSKTIDILCLDCQESCWVGQIPIGKESCGYVYASNEEAFKQARFFMKHLGHHLTVVDDTNRSQFDNGDMTEFEEAS